MFRLYTQAADGVAVWSEDHRLLLVGGYYFVELGRRSPVAGALADADQAWLGISIDGAEEASPRHPLGSVPFALVADTVDGLDSTKFMRVDRDTGTTGTIRTTGMDINPHEIAGGNRPWMTDGMRVGAGGSDNAYFGLIEEGANRAHAVVAWGDDVGDDLRFIFTRSGGPLAGEEAMRITSQGLVGIGTNDPQSLLDVRGAIRLGFRDECNGDTEGALRYHPEARVMQFCDGNEWAALGGGGGDDGARAISNEPIQDSGFQRLAASCRELRENGFDVDGVYWVDPNGGAPNDAFQVFCDMPDAEDEEGTPPFTRAGFEHEQFTPVAYYDFENHTADGRVRDLIGDNHLRIIGDPQAGNWGAVGRTYRINNAGSYFVSHGDFPRHMEGGTPKSVSAWVYAGNFNGDGDGVQPVAGFGSSRDDGSDCTRSSFSLAILSGRYYLVGCSDDVDTGVQVRANEWHHFVATFGEGTVRVYIDGIQRASVQKAYNTRGDFRRFTVGADAWWRTTAHKFGNGMIDEVRFYDYALAAGQIEELYNLQNLERECPDCRSLTLGGADGSPYNPNNTRGASYDQIQGGLTVDPRPDTPFLWIVNTADSSISKWDSRSVTEVGRYYVGLPGGHCPGACCWNGGCNMPSRTVVDANGDVYVANGGFGYQGTVAKIAARFDDCVDRNGNGRIDTSFSNRPLGWGEDECILWNREVGPWNAVLRAVVVDLGDERYPGGYVWVGSYNRREFYKLNPETGAEILRVGVPMNPYGGIVVPDRGAGLRGAEGRSVSGRLWIGNLGNGGTAWIDTETATVGPFIRFPAGNQSYGIAADQKGRIWFAGWCSQRALGHDPRTGQWTQVDTNFGHCSGRGITVDFDGRVWMGYGGDGQSYLASWHSDGFVPGGWIARNAINTIPLPAGHRGFAGIGISRNNYVWITHHSSSHLVRLDPETEEMQSFTGPNRTYTYSDFTGSVFRMVTGKGRYEHDIDAGCEEPTWTDFSWGMDAPNGAITRFYARSVDDPAEFRTARHVELATAPLENGPVDISQVLADANIESRQHLRLSMTMWVSETGQSPVVRTLRVRWRCE